MRVSAKPVALAILMRRHPPGTTYTGRDCGVGIHLEKPYIVGWGSPDHYPEWWVIVCEPYQTPAGVKILVAPQEFWLEWQLDPQGRAFPLGTMEAPVEQVYLPDYTD